MTHSWTIGRADATDYMGDLPSGSLYIEDERHNVVCEIDSCGVPLREHAEHARLIAAAPDLLEACEAIQREIDTVDGAVAGIECFHLWADVVRDAINKATKRSDGPGAIYERGKELKQ